MNIEIRHAEAEDYAALVEVFSQPGVIRGTLQLPFPSAELWRQRLSDKAEGQYHLVACVDGLLVGSLGLSTNARPRSRHRGDVGMAVHDDWQGKGVGSALLGAATDLADNWLGLIRLGLTVFVDNDAAIALYQKYNFEIEGTLRCFALRAGEYTDAYTMSRLNRGLD